VAARHKEHAETFAQTYGFEKEEEKK